MSGAAKQRWALASGGIVLLAFAWWIVRLPELRDRAAAAEQPGAPAEQDQRRATSTGELATSDETRAAAPDVERDAVALHTAPQPEQPWTVQLRGIDAAVPWTAPLLLRFERRVRLQVAVDGSGAARFVPPDTARHPAFQHLQVIAADPHYRLVSPFHRTDRLQHFGHDEFEVVGIAQLHGRVLGPDGVGLAARVQAFAWSSSGPHGPALARVVTFEDGTYVLRVPPDTDLLLLAEATADTTTAPLGRPRANPFAFDAGDNPPADDLLGAAIAEPRLDLLPASQRARGHHGAPRTLPDLRLTVAATLRGKVLFADGRPLPFANVVAQPFWASGPGWHEQHHWSPAEGPVRGAHTAAERDGTFALALPAGVSFRVMTTATKPLLRAGEPATVAMAPGNVELRVPGDVVTLRAVADGQMQPNVWFDLDDFSWRADAAGSTSVTLGPAATRVRARAGVRASAWVDLPPGARPPVVTLELLTPQLAQVRLQLRSAPPLLAADFVWKPFANDPAMTVTATRASADRAFEVNVPPGKYHLTVRGHTSEPGVLGPQRADHVLPLHVDVEVPPAGLDAAYDVAFGGRVQLDVRDANGVLLPGTFVLRDLAGRDVTPMTIAYDELGQARIEEPGVLQTWSRNHLATILPPGDYSLSVDVGERGSAQRPVTVRAASTVTVDVRF